ncbi:MAG TPA: DUF1232 domain-containing protein [Candidatus Polarisedimenticolaceae bacterium]|nr:DUF1232 domain-containing protein [Candidatus Polarisedimenticolaceae bacterium]
MKGVARAFGRMIKATLDRRYPNFPWRTALGLVGGFAYLVFPLDVLPDALLPIGLLDDAAVLAFVVRMIKKDVDAFRAWEAPR